MTANTAFSPQSKAELKSAVDECLKVSPKGDCPNGHHGPIGEWDVSSVTDMSYMFSYGTMFDHDISKWDVSSVKNMSGMFLSAKAFNRDISEWDVSSVENMHAMFSDATAFNVDISTWDVSRVTNMDNMFVQATSLKHVCILRGPTWVCSKATKLNMFEGLHGAILCWCIFGAKIYNTVHDKHMHITQIKITSNVTCKCNCTRWSTLFRYFFVRSTHYICTYSNT